MNLIVCREHRAQCRSMPQSGPLRYPSMSPPAMKQLAASRILRPYRPMCQVGSTSPSPMGSVRGSVRACLTEEWL